MSKISAFFVRIAPQHAISNLMHRMTRIRAPWYKNPQIKWFINKYKVDMSIAAEPDPTAYKDFNSFFTRSLRAGTRPLDKNEDLIISPVDGRISQFGEIKGQTLIQAKNHNFNLTSLLSGSEALARHFQDGEFCTIYLAPHDYHRIHMPVAGTLREMTYVPGALFSVNAHTADTVPDLFARNERVITIFDTERGPVAMILVGAINVGSMETSWHGCVTPPYGKGVTSWRYDKQEINFKRGDEMGRFNMGSTVVMLFANKKIKWNSNIKHDQVIEMGRALSSE